jgi:hypothetical protein
MASTRSVALLWRLAVWLLLLAVCHFHASSAGSSIKTSAATGQKKIEHFVVLFMENRAFDHLLGCLDLPGMDGIPASGHLLPIDPENSSKGHVNVTCGSADYICPRAPSYSFYDQKFPLAGKAPPINYSAPVKCGAFVPGGACRPNTKYVNLGNFTTAAVCQALCEAQNVDGCCWHTDRHITNNCEWVAGGTPFHAGDPAMRSSTRCARGAQPPGVNVSAFPYAAQSDAYSYQHGAHGDAIQMFGSSQIPVKAAIAHEFGVFNKLFSAVPSASTPNHVSNHWASIVHRPPPPRHLIMMLHLYVTNAIDVCTVWHFVWFDEQ